MTEEIEKTEAGEVNQLPLKSALLKEQQELVEANDKLLKEMQEREYTVSFNDKKVFSRLIKLLPLFFIYS